MKKEEEGRRRQKKEDEERRRKKTEEEGRRRTKREEEGSTSTTTGATLFVGFITFKSFYLVLLVSGLVVTTCYYLFNAFYNCLLFVLLHFSQSYFSWGLRSVIFPVLHLFFFRSASKFSIHTGSVLLSPLNTLNAT